jgi:hypothetical protein
MEADGWPELAAASFPSHNALVCDACPLSFPEGALLQQVSME